MLIINPSTGQLSLLGSLPLQPKKYQGGAAAPDGSIWCLPECGEQILRIDPASPRGAGDGGQALAGVEALGPTGALEAGRMEEGGGCALAGGSSRGARPAAACVGAAAATEHGDCEDSEHAGRPEGGGEEGGEEEEGAAGGGESAAAGGGASGETSKQRRNRKRRQHRRAAKKGHATQAGGDTPSPSLPARAWQGGAGGEGRAGTWDLATSLSPQVKDTSATPQQPASPCVSGSAVSASPFSPQQANARISGSASSAVSCSPHQPAPCSCSGGRIGVDDSEPVSDAHWAAWDLAWEAAGRLDGARRGLVTLDEALAMALDEAFMSGGGKASSVGKARQAVIGEAARGGSGEAAGGAAGEGMGGATWEGAEGAMKAGAAGALANGAGTVEAGAAEAGLSTQTLGSPAGETAKTPPRARWACKPWPKLCTSCCPFRRTPRKKKRQVAAL